MVDSIAYAINVANLFGVLLNSASILFTKSLIIIICLINIQSMGRKC